MNYGSASSGIRIVEVAIEDIARHFIVKTDVVVTHHAGIGHREQVVDATGKFCFANAFIPRFLRRDARHHYRARLRQIVIGGLTVKHLGFADDVKFVIGTDSRKLRRSVQRRMGAKGFVIVEQKVGRAAESDTSNLILLKIDVSMVNDWGEQSE